MVWSLLRKNDTKVNRCVDYEGKMTNEENNMHNKDFVTGLTLVTVNN